MFGQPDEANQWNFDTVAQVEAVNRLLYVVENGEPFCVLGGAYGTGKSAVMQRVAEELANSGRRAVLQNLASLNCRAALWHLCGALSIFSHSDADSSELMIQIRDELTARAECRHKTVVLLDDVDLAQRDVQTVLQLLMSIAEASHGHTAVLVAAERSLPFEVQQRTTLHVELKPLDDTEAVEFAVRYLAHLECPVDDVTATGWRAIADLSGGLPAQLMRVCNVVRAVSGMHSGPVDAALIHQAATELLPLRAA